MSKETDETWYEYRRVCCRSHNSDYQDVRNDEEAIGKELGWFEKLADVVYSFKAFSVFLLWVVCERQKTNVPV